MSGYGTVWAEINLDNLKDNLNLVRKQVDFKTKILAIVKADAYGHGLCEISQKLYNEGVDYFGVASINEGIELINCGMSVSILVLNTVLPEELQDLLEAGLIPTINGLSLAEIANAYGKSKNRRMKIHIRVDTSAEGEGMPHKECPDFLMRLSEMEGIEVEGIYTHLVSAYGPEDELVHSQLNNFKAIIDFANEHCIQIPCIHAASSPAIFGYSESHFNMVRAGTVLYGMPFIKDDIFVSLIKPVMQVKSRVACIKEFSDGFCFGYGVKYSRQKNLRIAHVSIGYADAFFLLGADKLKVLIGGRFVSVYGKAGMDHIKLDISEKEMDDIKTGDEVVIFGTQQDESIGAFYVAQACGISKVNCESICFLGKRVKRIFIENGKIIDSE
jgi:alanine racemase